MTRAAVMADAVGRLARTGAPLYVEGQLVGDLFVVEHRGRDVLMNLDAMLAVSAADHGLALVRFGLADGAEVVPVEGAPQVEAPRISPDRSPTEQIGELVSWLRDLETPVLLRISPLESLLPAEPGQFAQPHAARIAEQLAEFVEGSALRSRGHRLVGISRYAAAADSFLSQPGVTRHRIALPEREEVVRAVTAMTRHTMSPMFLEEGLTPEDVAMLGRGMALRDLQSLRSLSSAAAPVTAELIRTQKEEVLGRRLGDLATVVRGRRTLADVSGLPHVRAMIERTKALFERRGYVPLRYSLAGPPGVGKTLISEVIGAELNLVVVEIRQVKSQWYGASEERMLRMTEIIEAAAPVIVVIDEADEAGLGRRPQTSGSDGGATDAALRAILFRWIGDNGAGLGVSVLAMTNRPDRYDDAAESRLETIAVLPPAPAGVMEIEARRRATPLADRALDVVRERDDTMMSGRDAVRILERADAIALESERDVVTGADLAEALRDTYVHLKPSVWLQVLIALFATGNERYLPWNGGRAPSPDVVVPPRLRPYLRPDGRLDREKVRAEIEALLAASHGA